MTDAERPNPLIRQLLTSPFVIVLTIVAMVITVVSTVFAAADGAGDRVIGHGMFAGPMIATFAVVLQVSWQRERSVFDAFLRTMVYGPLVALACAVAGFVTTWVPSVAQTMAAARSENDFHYWFEEPHPFFLPLLGTVFLAMLAGLVASFVVLLVHAYFRPRELATANMNDLSARNAARVRRANIALAWVVVLIFLIPTLIVAGASESDARSIPEAAQRALLFFSEPTWYLGDVAWMLGLLLIPVGIALIFVIVRNQRVDQGARGSAGVPVGRQRKERNNNRPR